MYFSLTNIQIFPASQSVNFVQLSSTLFAVANLRAHIAGNGVSTVVLHPGRGWAACSLQLYRYTGLPASISSQRGYPKTGAPSPVCFCASCLET